MPIKKNNTKRHEVFFIPLKELWLSFLNKPTRDKFPESEQATSRFLVSTSVFLDQFWPTVPRIIQSSVSGERAWFGIRSIMNGGRFGHTIPEFSDSDFAQLDPNGQIPKGDTKNYFDDVELKSIIEAQNLYVSWKRKYNKYDELDLVIAAFHSYSGVEKDIKDEIPSIHHNHKKAIETLVTRSIEQDIMLSASVERFMRKNHNNKAIFNGLKRFITARRSMTSQGDVRHREQTLVGQTKSGVNVFKTEITKADRLFFSYISGNEFNNGGPYILVREICHTNDQNTVVSRICKTLSQESRTSSHSELKPDEVKNHIYLDVDGPLKPVVPITSLDSFEDLFDPNNICLDSNQIEAISDNVPLLIDGLAGTGKTAILAARAALRLAPVATSSSILVAAAMPHVVTRISEGVKKRTEKHRASGEIELTMNFCGLDSEIGHVRTIEELSSHFPSLGFDEIILDECQDLTFLEFEVLSRITKGKNPRRFAIAGDPMQTLNPTGFDWSKIVAMFREKGVDKAYTKPSNFHMNYRSQSNIVHLANGIQRIRQKATGNQGVVMDSRRSPLDAKPYLIHIHNEQDIAALRKIILDSGKGKNDAIVICWATDDISLSRMLEGEDLLLNEIWDELRTKDYDEMDGFRTKFLIHSSSSIKGDEQNAVVLYNFASYESARRNLISMTQNFDHITVAKSDSKIAIDYAFSRLYVAITRAFDHVFVVENDEGFEFWKECKFFDERGFPIELFEESHLLSTVVASRQDVFMVSEETTKANFHKNRKKWDEEGNVDALKIAVNIGEQLLKDLIDHEVSKQFWRLRGDLSWRNYTIATTDSDREYHLGNALDAFGKADLPERIAPVYFAQENWVGCKSMMRENSAFAKLISAYCSIQINEAVSISDIIGLQVPKSSPRGWEISPKSILGEIKSKLLEMTFESDEFGIENETVFEHREWFGVNQILDFIAKQRLECKLLVKLWNENNNLFHEPSAPLFVNSVSRSLDPGTEGIDDLDRYRDRFGRLEDRFRKISITLREKWLFKEIDANSQVNMLQRKFFVEHKHPKKLIALRKDPKLDPGYREKAKVLHHAYNLLEDYLTSSLNPRKEFKGYERLLLMLELMKNYPWYSSFSKHSDLRKLLNRPDGIFEFIYDLSKIIKSDPLPKNSRFHWLNDPAYFNQIISNTDEVIQDLVSLNKASGTSLGHDLQIYHAGRMMYHIASEGGRKFQAYTDALDSLSKYNPRMKNYIQLIWKTITKYIDDNTTNEHALTDAEFSFLIASLRHGSNRRPKSREQEISISKARQKRLFDAERSERFALELMKIKFRWPFQLEDGNEIDRPKPKEVEQYLAKLTHLGMEDEIDFVLRSLPKDPKVEMEKFKSVTTYQAFWKLLVETSKSFDDFHLLATNYTLKSWIDVINGLSWGTFTYSDLDDIELSNRMTAFNNISELCEFSKSLATKDNSVKNGLFFLQFAKSIDWYITSQHLVLDTTEIYDENDISLVVDDLEMVLNRFDPRTMKSKKSMKQSAKGGGKTLDERRKEQEKVKRFDDLRDAVFEGFNLKVMFKNRIAAELHNKTLAELESFADKFNLDVTKASSKKPMLKRVLNAFSVDDTEVAGYLIG